MAVNTNASSARSPSWAINDRPKAVRAAPATLALKGTNSITGIAAAMTTHTIAMTYAAVWWVKIVRRGRNKRSTNRAGDRNYLSDLRFTELVSRH